MRRHMVVHALADAMEANRRDVVLGTGIVASADLDRHVFEILWDLSGREHFRERSGQALRGGDAEPTCIGARARDDVFHQFRPWIAEVCRCQSFVQMVELLFGHPAEAKILLNRRPEVAVRERLAHIRYVPHLIGGEVAHGKADERSRKTGLLLGNDIGPPPHFKGRFPMPIGRAISVRRGMVAVGLRWLDQPRRQVGDDRKL